MKLSIAANFNGRNAVTYAQTNPVLNRTNMAIV
jgi:hypothetical protein